MIRNPTDFTRPAAKAILAAIVALLASGPATIKQMIAATGHTDRRVREHVQYLAGQGQIYCCQRAVNGFGGSTPAQWEINPDYVATEHDAAAGMERQVTVRTSWTPNHVRMPMDCLLFGVPKVLQGLAA